MAEPLGSNATSRYPLTVLVGSKPLEVSVGSPPLIVNLDNWIPVRVIVTNISDDGHQLTSEGIPITFSTSS